MNDDLAFLLNAAGQLRELAQTAPEIATIADDLEATAAEHSQDRQRGARVDD
jgi:hypothetical protein